MARNITAMELAKLAGVSHITVSRAFDPSASIRAEMREKIQQLAREHGYVPNSIAAALKRSRSDLVAIVAASLSHYEYDQIRHLTRELQAIGLTTLLVNCQDSANASEFVGRAAAYRASYAIVYADAMPNEEVKRFFGTSRLILVRNQPHLDGDHITLRIDPSAAIDAAAADLASSGRRNILWLNGALSSAMNARRKELFRTSLSRHGLTFIGEAHGDYRYNPALREIEVALQQRPSIDAIISANDEMAFAAIDAVRQSGRRIPDDVAVIGHDGLEMAFWSAYQLSTIQLDHEAYATETVNLIRKMEAGEKEIPHQVEIQCGYRKGQTT
jgi:DNA-binding LacI/PurR family transcriptional regulator